MSRELQILWVGRRSQRAWDELCRGYRNRIARQVKVTDRPVLVKARKDAKAQLAAEAAAIGKALRPRSWVIALDRRGRQFDSETFAAQLGRRLADRPHGISFLVGSDLGLAPSIRESADQRLSLGRMTLPHHLARLVLYEQIYRALSIEAGMQYHRVPFE